MSEFGDYQSASRMRGIIESIATGVIDRLRPEVKTGTVEAIDAERRFVSVRLLGDTDGDPVKARCSDFMIPRMASSLVGESQADVVRVAGKPGGYYICDFIRGTPRPSSASAWLGQVSSFYCTLDSIPVGWLPMLGQEFDIEKYPDLFKLLGYSSTLPDSQDRYLIGSKVGDSTLEAGVVGGTNEFQLALVNIPSHSHSMDHGHDITVHANNGNGGTAVRGGTTGTAIGQIGGPIVNYTGSTGNAGAHGSGTSPDPVAIKPKYFALWLCIRAI